MRNKVILLLILMMFSMLNGTEITIGEGTQTGKGLPIEPYYGYTYSQVIYLQSEINNPGNITHIRWHYDGGSNLSSSNDWTIYLGHTDKTEFISTTDWISVDNMTEVYSNTFTGTTAAGWIEFDINNFAYNNSDNLVIAVDENKSGYNSGSDEFYCSAVDNYRALTYRDDGTNPNPSSPPTATYRHNSIANIQLVFNNPNAPTTITNQIPADNATDIVSSSGTITWNWGANSTTYDLWFGLAGNMIEIVTNADAGVEGTQGLYNYSNLNPLTEYEWQIVISNDIFTDYQCNLSSFQTAFVPITSYPALENFETFTVNSNATGYENNWSTDPANNTTNYRWNINSGTTPSSNSGPNNDHTTGSGKYLFTEASSGSNGSIANLFSTTYNFSNLENPQLSFWYHMYGSTMSSLQVDINIGSGWIEDIFSISGQQQTNGSVAWNEEVISLIDYAGEPSVSLRFRATRSNNYYGDMAIDDVKIFEGATTPIFTITPEDKNFGAINVDANSESQIFTISNEGTDGLIIQSVSLSGTDADQFILTDTNGYPITLNNSEEITISAKFSPTSQGDKTANIIITDNLGRAEHLVTLNGNGLGATFSVSPSSKDFGTVNVSESSSDQIFTIGNDGGGTLTISEINIAGTYADQFVLTDTNGYPINLNSGEEVTISAKFSPTSQGDKTANIIITDNLGRAEHLVTLNGNGLGATFSVSPSSKDFGTVNVSESSSDQTFTIGNDGGGTLTISEINIAGTYTDQFVLTDTNSYPINLNSGEEVTISAEFSPTSQGDKTANIIITDNLRRVTNTIQLSGYAYDATISTFPWLEEFNTYLPTDWQESNGQLSEETFMDYQSSDWDNDGFGNNGTTGSARMNIWSDGKHEWMITPTIVLPQNHNYCLEFDLALTQYASTSSATLGSDDKFAVVISTDNGITWSNANILEEWNSTTPISNTGDHQIYDLSAYSGNVKFGFYAESTVSNADVDVFVDNVKVGISNGSGNGNTSNGDNVDIDVSEMFLNGQLIDPDVHLDPENALTLGISVSVSGEVRNISVPNGLSNPEISYLLNISGSADGENLAVTLDYTGYTGSIDAIAWFNGIIWQNIANYTIEGNSITFTITLPSIGRDRDNGIEILLGDDSALPVTLSSFSIAVIQNEYIKLNWVSESESNMLGYKIYRSKTDIVHIEYASEIIEATNTSETQTYQFNDFEMEGGNSYTYWLESIELDGSSNIFEQSVSISFDSENDEPSPEIPTKTELIGNYPNPFNPSTSIDYNLKSETFVSIIIYNAKGQKVKILANEQQNIGHHIITWDGTNNDGQTVSAGIYFYRMKTDSYSSTKKMIIIK